MKKFDIVKLIKLEKHYREMQLNLEMYGIVLKPHFDSSAVLFFNFQNMSDYAIIDIANKDLQVQKEKVPDQFIQEFVAKGNKFGFEKNTFLAPLGVKEYDWVELLVEDEKYNKYGIHKGDRGCVMESYAIENSILVDFSGVTESGDYYGDCISVNVTDLKVI